MREVLVYDHFAGDNSCLKFIIFYLFLVRTLQYFRFFAPKNIDKLPSNNWFGQVFSPASFCFVQLKTVL